MSSADEAREMVDATGTRRRLQALLANGYRAKDLVTSLGLHISCQRIIRSEKVSAVIRDSVAQLYRELEDQVGRRIWPANDTVGSVTCRRCGGIPTSSTTRLPSQQASGCTQRFASKTHKASAGIAEYWWTSSPKHERNVSLACTDWGCR